MGLYCLASCNGWVQKHTMHVVGCKHLDTNIFISRRLDFCRFHLEPSSNGSASVILLYLQRIHFICSFREFPSHTIFFATCKLNIFHLISCICKFSFQTIFSSVFSVCVILSNTWLIQMKLNMKAKLQWNHIFASKNYFYIPSYDKYIINVRFYLTYVCLIPHDCWQGRWKS